MALILASASPRRQELLRSAGIAFSVQATDIPEIPKEGEHPTSCSERLAREKALTVAASRPRDFVLGADTIVVVDQQILGKPREPSDAARMLRLLSGRSHLVTTGVCLITPAQKQISSRPSGAGQPESETRITDVRSETTLVTMTKITEDEIQYYIATGEPADKAGAYAIQGIASRWITRIEGDYSNVVGLPVSLVYRMLTAHQAL
jgi:septum formation protein